MEVIYYFGLTCAYILSAIFSIPYLKEFLRNTIQDTFRRDCTRREGPFIERCKAPELKSPKTMPTRINQRPVHVQSGLNSFEHTNEAT